MRRLLITTLFSIAVMGNYAQEYYLTSPDSNLTAKISIGTAAAVELTKRSEQLLRLDDIDLVAADAKLEGMKVKRSTTQTSDKRKKRQL
jgi:hypothetical protein